MYAKFYGLDEPPFRITPDPRFLYLGPAHREALATLIYGIRERKGIVALTGGVGTGKTTLIEGLLERLSADCTFVRIRDPRADFTSMVRELLSALGLSSTGVERSEGMRLLWERLSSPDAQSINPVLVIDEAQDVRDEVLEDFRLLSNLETHERKLIQMLLVGQPEFRRRIEAPLLEALRQRIALSTTIHPFTLTECTAYVRHRLSVAGAEGDGIFALGAFEAIHDYARGIPRLVNVVCDGALSMGYATGTRPIHGGLVREVVKDLRGEPPPDPRSDAAAAAGSRAVPGFDFRIPRGWRGRLAPATLAVAGVALGIAAGPALKSRLDTPRVASSSPSRAPTTIAAREPARAPSPPAVPTPQPAAESPAPPSPGTAPLPWPDGAQASETGHAAPARVEPAPSEPVVEPVAAPVPEPTFEGIDRLEDESPEPVRIPIRPSARSERPLKAEKLAKVDQPEKREKSKKPAPEPRKAKPPPPARSAVEEDESEPRAEAAEPGAEQREASSPETAVTVLRPPPAPPASTPSHGLPSSAAPSSRATGAEPRMLIVPDAADGNAVPASVSLKVRDLYASHRADVSEASPRFVPGEAVHLIAVYEVAGAPPSGADVTIDLWVRGPTQEDIPSLGARRQVRARAGTFQAHVSRALPASAPAGVYGLVARVTAGGVEARRVFLFRVE